MILKRLVCLIRSKLICRGAADAVVAAADVSSDASSVGANRSGRPQAFVLLAALEEDLENAAKDTKRDFLTRRAYQDVAAHIRCMRIDLGDSL